MVLSINYKGKAWIDPIWLSDKWFDLPTNSLVCPELSFEDDHDDDVQSEPIVTDL